MIPQRTAQIHLQQQTLLRPSQAGNAQTAVPTDVYRSSASFSGLSQALYKGTRGMVKSIEWVDQTPIRQLLLAGIFGMTTPRVILEWRERGRDMVIETLFRELTGDISMVFLSGWMGSLAAGVASTKAIQGWMNKSYPGIKMDWRKHQVNGKSMETLGNLFIHELNEGAKNQKTVQQVKESFINNIFDRLRLSSRDNAAHVLKGLDAELDALAKNDSSVTSIRSSQFSHELTEGRLKSRMGNGLAKKVLEANSDEALNEILKSFMTETELAELDAKIKAKPNKKFGLRGIKVDMIESAMANGATTFSHKTTTLKSLLQETQSMVSQFFDPSLKKFNLGDADSVVTADTAKQVQEFLTGPADQKMTWFKRLIPKKSKGLLNYMMGAKTWLMVVPLTLALGITISEAFINNWLTKRRHGGKVFSPYLGGPTDNNAMAKLFNSVMFKQPLKHASANNAFSDFLHPRRSMWMQSGQGQPFMNGPHQRSYNQQQGGNR